MLVIATVVLNVTSVSGQIRRQPFSSLTKTEQERVWKSRVERANRVLKGIDESKTKDWAINVLETAVTQDSSALAMNSLGIAYLQGNGVEADTTMGISWMEKAGQQGYSNAYHDLGIVYKYSKYGVGQDFKKAYSYFNIGAKLCGLSCLYDKGYMLYKGLGCQQDYAEAVKCFKRAAKERHLPSIYMLGLCYRNGYGVERDEEQATDLLFRAAMLGYRDAREELDRPNAENSLYDPEVQAPAYMPEISPVVNDTCLLAGSYHGCLLTYDWSGQYVIGEKPMYMTIHKDGPEVSGLLSLGADTVSFAAELTTDNRLDFSKGGLSQKERYTTNGTVKYRIDNVLFDICNSKISGRLNLYSLSQKEPERPMCFELVRNGQESLAQQCTASKVTVSPEYPGRKTDSPFSHRFPLTINSQNVVGKWKCAAGFIKELGLPIEGMKGNCKFRKDGTFRVRINSGYRMHKLIIITIKGTYQIEGDSITTKVRPDDISCYIDPRVSYPDPIEILDDWKTMNRKDIQQTVFDVSASHAVRQSEKIKNRMLKFWRWEKEPVRLSKKRLFIGYKAMFKKSETK